MRVEVEVDVEVEVGSAVATVGRRDEIWRRRIAGPRRDSGRRRGLLRRSASAWSGRGRRRARPGDLSGWPFGSLKMRTFCC